MTGLTRMHYEDGALTLEFEDGTTYHAQMHSSHIELHAIRDEVAVSALGHPHKLTFKMSPRLELELRFVGDAFGKGHAVPLRDLAARPKLIGHGDGPDMQKPDLVPVEELNFRG
jgi:hypothetical protein